MNYDKLVEALRDLHRDPRPSSAVWLFDNQIALYDAADAIEALQAEKKKTVTQIFGEEQQKWTEYCAALGNRIKELEQQMPKQGEWELIDGAEPMRWGCSRCKYLSWETSNYCPRCGAKMEVQE